MAKRKTVEVHPYPSLVDVFINYEDGEREGVTLTYRAYADQTDPLAWISAETGLPVGHQSISIIEGHLRAVTYDEDEQEAAQADAGSECFGCGSMFVGELQEGEPCPFCGHT